MPPSPVVMLHQLKLLLKVNHPLLQLKVVNPLN
jgi:hypothetical protein